MTENTDVVEAPATVPGADPRPGFAKAVALAGDALAAVRPEQYGDATPCEELTVRELSAHLVVVLRRVAALGRGEEALSVPDAAEDVADGGWAAAWGEAARETETLWADPELLARMHRLPFATLPGAVALAVYTNEITVHTWDLATATGQRPSWDPQVVASALETMRRALPAEPRGGPVPFAPVVEVAPDAPDIDKLVAWTGRRP